MHARIFTLTRIHTRIYFDMYNKYDGATECRQKWQWGILRALTRHSNTRRFAHWLGLYNFTHQSLSLALSLENLSLVHVFVCLLDCFASFILDSTVSLFLLFVGFTSSKNIVQNYLKSACACVRVCVYTYIIVLNTLNLGLKYELPEKSINYSV